VRAIHAGRLFALLVALYLCVDFSNPFIPGAFVFDTDQSVDAVNIGQHPVAARDGHALLPSSLGASQPHAVAPARPAAPRVVAAAAVPWLVALRDSRARLPAPSSLNDPH